MHARLWKLVWRIVRCYWVYAEKIKINRKFHVFVIQVRMSKLTETFLHVGNIA